MFNSKNTVNFFWFTIQFTVSIFKIFIFILFGVLHFVSGTPKNPYFSISNSIGFLMFLNFQFVSGTPLKFTMFYYTKSLKNFWFTIPSPINQIFKIQQHKHQQHHFHQLQNFQVVSGTHPILKQKIFFRLKLQFIFLQQIFHLQQIIHLQQIFQKLQTKNHKKNSNNLRAFYPR